MTCPDTERFLELALEESLDLEAREHLQQCGTCRTRVHLIKAARAAYIPDLLVPEELVLSARDMVVTQASAAEQERLTLPAAVASFLLGCGTILVAAAGTGSLGGDSLVPLSAIAGLAGIAAVFFESRQPRGVLA
jgi:hypothetical protein